MTIYQIAILVYILVYFGVILGLRSYILYKKTGVNPFSNVGAKGIVGYNEKVLSFCTLLIPIIAFNYVFLESNYQYLSPINFLEHSAIQNIGVVMSYAGLLFTFIAQIQMKESWRIGIPSGEKLNLIINGLFKYSRNPIYLGLLMSFTGFFLLVPNAVSLCFLALMYASISVKIRLEEEFLKHALPNDYEIYMKRVRRWL